MDVGDFLSPLWRSEVHSRAGRPPHATRLPFTAPELTDAQVVIQDRQDIGESLPAAKTQPSNASRSRRRTTPRKASSSKEQRRASSAGTKQDLVLQMLRRQSGVSIEVIIAKTNWQAHSVRGFLSGVVRKKLKLPLVSDIGKDDVRRYHIATSKSAKS